MDWCAGSSLQLWIPGSLKFAPVQFCGEKKNYKTVNLHLLVWSCWTSTRHSCHKRPLNGTLEQWLMPTGRHHHSLNFIGLWTSPPSVTIDSQGPKSETSGPHFSTSLPLPLCRVSTQKKKEKLSTSSSAACTVREGGGAMRQHPTRLSIRKKAKPEQWGWTSTLMEETNCVSARRPSRSLALGSARRAGTDDCCFSGRGSISAETGTVFHLATGYAMPKCKSPTN